MSLGWDGRPQRDVVVFPGGGQHERKEGYSRVASVTQPSCLDTRVGIPHCLAKRRRIDRTHAILLARDAVRVVQRLTGHCEANRVFVAEL
jgi:hypothetical protein